MSRVLIGNYQDTDNGNVIFFPFLPFCVLKILKTEWYTHCDLNILILMYLIGFNEFYPPNRHDFYSYCVFIDLKAINNRNII